MTWVPAHVPCGSDGIGEARELEGRWGLPCDILRTFIRGDDGYPKARDARGCGAIFRLCMHGLWTCPACIHPERSATS